MIDIMESDRQNCLSSNKKYGMPKPEHILPPTQRPPPATVTRHFGLFQARTSVVKRKQRPCTASWSLWRGACGRRFFSWNIGPLFLARPDYIFFCRLPGPKIRHLDNLPDAPFYMNLHQFIGTKSYFWLFNFTTPVSRSFQIYYYFYYYIFTTLLLLL